MNTLAYVYVPVDPGTIDRLIATMHQWGIQNDILATFLGVWLAGLIILEAGCTGIGIFILLFEITDDPDWLELLWSAVVYIITTFLVSLGVGLFIGLLAAIFAAIGSIF